MAQDWQDGYYENKNLVDAVVASAIAAEDIVTYDPVTGQIMDDATAITGIASMTFAQMEALTADQLLALAGVPVHINDVHQSSDGVGGSYIVRDSSPAGWAQISGPFYYATFDLAPSPTTYAGWRIRVGNCGLGGADMIARGGYWRYPSGRQLVGSVTDLTISSNKSTEQSLIKVPIPINNSKSLIQNGDGFIIDLHLGKSGTTNKIIRSVRLGTDASVITNNTWLDAVTAGAASSIGLDELLPFHRVSATSVKRDTAVGFSLYAGASSTTRNTAVTVSNLDSALQYLDLSMYMDGTTDTLTCEAANIFIDHGV